MGETVKVEISAPPLQAPTLENRGMHGSVKVDGVEIAPYLRSFRVDCPEQGLLQVHLDLRPMPAGITLDVTAIDARITEWTSVIHRARMVVDTYRITDLSRDRTGLEGQIRALDHELRAIGE